MSTINIKKIDYSKSNLDEIKIICNKKFTSSCWFRESNKSLNAKHTNNTVEELPLQFRQLIEYFLSINNISAVSINYRTIILRKLPKVEWGTIIDEVTNRIMNYKIP